METNGAVSDNGDSVSVASSEAATSAAETAEREAQVTQAPVIADPTAAMHSALADFDGLRVDAAIQAGFDVRRTYSAKYRNALHELVLNYTAKHPADRPAKLHLKFIDILTVLLQSGLDINDADYRNQTPLHLAAASGSAAGGGHPEIIKALLASGARVKQPDSGQQTALHKAVLAGSRGDVAALLEGGADPNHVDNMGHSPVHVAAKRKRNAEILTQLVKAGGKASLNHPEQSRQSKGASPLHTAARLGQVDNAEVLLKLGADVHVVDASGQTALHVAAAHEITGRLCAMLIQRGARVDLRDSLLSETPLHKAVRANTIDNVAVLVAHRATDVRAVDVADNTALHKAAALPAVDLAVWNMLLAAEGASAASKAVNADGATVLQVAQRAHNSMAQALLRAFDAQISTY